MAAMMMATIDNEVGLTLKKHADIIFALVLAKPVESILKIFLPFFVQGYNAK
jgi:hypothetical protein